MEKLVSVSHLYKDEREWDKTPVWSKNRGFERQFNQSKYLASSGFNSWLKNPEYFDMWNTAWAALLKEMEEIPLSLLLRMYEITLEAQMLADMIDADYKAGVFNGALLLGRGQEGIGIGVALAMRDDDIFGPTHRDWGGTLAHGTPSLWFFLNHYFRVWSGITNNENASDGWDPNVHILDLAHFNIGFQVSDMTMNSGLINPAVAYYNRKKQIAKGSRLDFNEYSAGVDIAGDGATGNGLWYASKRLAKALRLPVLGVIEDNQIACRTPASESHGGINLVNLGFAFEMPSITVDGDDVLEVYLGTRLMLHFARLASHPALLHCITFRRAGHNQTEDVRYQKNLFSEGYYDAMMQHVTFPLYRIRTLAQELGVTEDEILKVKDEVKNRLQQYRQIALDAPKPVGDRKLLRSPMIDMECVRSKELAKKYPPSNSTRELTIKEAIREALEIKHKEDNCFMEIGEDIGETGGVFGVTAGLAQKFKDCVKNSTLDEGALSAFVAGWGLMGGRIVGEYQFLNFSLSNPSPILTFAATRPTMIKRGIPGVMRGPTGYSPSSNTYHEEWVESIFGKKFIKIVIPSNARDAKGLLLSCIEDPDIILFEEEIGNYNDKCQVPEGLYYTPLEAEVKKQGTDITLMTWGPKMVNLALKAAEELAQNNPRIDIEVIDLRILGLCWDRKKVFDSVHKTHRAIILHEDSEFLGLGAEFGMQIYQELFWELKVPVMRIAAANTFIPGATVLEDARLPHLEDIINHAKKLMEDSL